MEENVWSNPEVKKILDEDYVILALYVDDRTPLLDDDNYQTLGEKNFEFNSATLTKLHSLIMSYCILITQLSL